MKNNILKLSNIQFTLVFSVLIYVVHNTINIDKFTKWFIFKDVLDYSGIIAFFLIGLFLFISIFSLFAHRYVIKSFAIFVVISSAASTYFIQKYSIAVDRSMILNVWYTDTTESLPLISSSMIPYVIFLILIPIAIILKIKISFDKPLKHLVKIIITFILSIVLALCLVYLKFNSIHKAGNASKKYIVFQLVPINFIVGIGSAIKNNIQDKYKTNAKQPEIKGRVLSNDDLVIVLAVGETSRQKNFALYGYGKETNPLLSKKNGIHALNGIAKYGSTIHAIPNILSRDDIKLASVTSFLDIPTSCYSNYTVYGNCGTVEEIMVHNCGHDGHCYDEDVIPLLKNDLESYKSGKKMTILHIGGGSHGPIYSDRSPKEFQKFKPQCEDPDVINKCTKEELYNAFDNTILYVDYVVSNIIDTLDNAKVPYVFFYISDHGESLLENDRIFHGMPPGIKLPEEQAAVPLLVKSSIPIDVIKKDEYKQQDIYDTILDLFSIEIDILKKDRVFVNKKN